MEKMQPKTAIFSIYSAHLVSWSLCFLLYFSLLYITLLHPHIGDFFFLWEQKKGVLLPFHIWRSTFCQYFFSLTFFYLWQFFLAHTASVSSICIYFISRHFKKSSIVNFFAACIDFFPCTLWTFFCLHDSQSFFFVLVLVFLLHLICFLGGKELFIWLNPRCSRASPKRKSRHPPPFYTCLSDLKGPPSSFCNTAPSPSGLGMDSGLFDVKCYKILS